jgi:hypothetical protein
MSINKIAGNKLLQKIAKLNKVFFPTNNKNKDIYDTVQKFNTK